MKTEYKGYVLDSTNHGVDIFLHGTFFHTIESEEAGLTEANWIRRGEEWVDEQTKVPDRYDYFEFMDRADGAMDSLNRMHGHVVALAHPEAAAAYEAANDALYNLYQTAANLFFTHTAGDPDHE